MYRPTRDKEKTIRSGPEREGLEEKKFRPQNFLKMPYAFVIFGPRRPYRVLQEYACVTEGRRVRDGIL